MLDFRHSHCVLQSSINIMAQDHDVFFRMLVFKIVSDRTYGIPVFAEGLAQFPVFIESEISIHTFTTGK
jgi:hypothetical protein